MYTQPTTSPSARPITVYVKPSRRSKWRACISRSRRLSSGDIARGHELPPHPGVPRMCSMDVDQAAKSSSLCCGPSGSRTNSGVSRRRGTVKSTGTNNLNALEIELSTTAYFFAGVRAASSRESDRGRAADPTWGWRSGLTTHTRVGAVGGPARVVSPHRQPSAGATCSRMLSQRTTSCDASLTAIRSAAPTITCASAPR